MDCNRAESDLGDESPMSNDDHSEHEDDLKDCDSSDEGNNGVTNPTANPINGSAMDFALRSPERNPDIPLNHTSQFPSNHSLGILGFMGLPNLSNVQHGDVLEKLKMQVRDVKVNLMDNEYSSSTNFPGSLPTPPNTAFTLPNPSLSNFTHSQPQNLSQSQSSGAAASHSNGFPFTPPNAPSSKDANPGSNSSTSSEASNSSQQNNGWSFEEQFKQVRQLYEISDDPKRKEFLDDLFSFMQKRGTPINRLPIMAKSVLDLYELYNLVIARGGLVDVINKKLWQEIIKGLHLPSSITSAAFTLRTQYMKYLYPYECEKKNLSTPAELQAAIDGNRREGRRSSYGQFEPMHHSQLQMSQIQRSTAGLQQMSPLALVTHGNPQAAVHHRLMQQQMGQMPNIVTHELEQRMMEYLKLFQAQKDPHRSQSPEITPREALNALEMSRVALWSMYHNNTSPPSSVNTSPQGIEPQREALNLSDSPPNVSLKRERDISEKLSNSGREDFNQPPAAKRGVPPNFHAPAMGISTITAATSSTSAMMPGISTTAITNDEQIPLLDKSNSRNEHVNGEGKSVSSPIRINQSHRLQNHNHLSENERQNKEEEEQQQQPNHNRSHKHEPQQQPHTNFTNGDVDCPILTGLQFKVSRKGIGINGEQQLVVNLEMNGIQYEGVLFASNNPPISEPSLLKSSGKSESVKEHDNDGDNYEKNDNEEKPLQRQLDNCNNSM